MSTLAATQSGRDRIMMLLHERNKPCALFWPAREASVRASTWRSKAWSWQSGSMERRSTCITRSSTTSTSSTASAMKGWSSSIRWKKCPKGPTCCTRRTAFRPKSAASPRHAGCKTIDATCPLVTKVHLEAIRYASLGYTILLIGHDGHDEVIGTMGEAPQAIRLVESPEDVDRLEIDDSSKLAYLTQTTLSVDDANRIISRLRARFPKIDNPPKEDICYATQNRQEAVKTVVARSRRRAGAGKSEQFEQSTAGRAFDRKRTCRPT